MNEPVRDSRLRRDINELLLYRNGRVEHSKLWANIGCGIVAWWMVTIPDRVWTDWIASLAIASALIAPDMLRKMMALRAGETTTSSSSSQSTVTTKATP